MAGLRGNIAWFMGARNGSSGAKGTPATVGAATSFKTPFVGGNIGPTREIDQLAETDSSRDRGVSYVVTGAVEGSPEFYVRDASIGAYLYWALGGAAVTGTTNLTHTLTPASTIPYVTFWRNLSDTLYERFDDCKVGGLTISAEAGQPLTATANIMGRGSKFLTADPGAAAALASGTVYNYNNATVTLAGGATSLIRSFELSIENNLQMQQTDDVVAYDVVEGTREVNLSFDLIFETFHEYNKFHYASVGTTPPTNLTPQASTIYTTDAIFDFSLGANNAVKFTLPSIAYEEFPVEPSAAGDPITVSVRAVAQRGGSPVVTAEVKNQVTTYLA